MKRNKKNEIFGPLVVAFIIGGLLGYFAIPGATQTIISGASGEWDGPFLVSSGYTGNYELGDRLIRGDPDNYFDGCDMMEWSAEKCVATGGKNCRVMDLAGIPGEDCSVKDPTPTLNKPFIIAFGDSGFFTSRLTTACFVDQLEDVDNYQECCQNGAAYQTANPGTRVIDTVGMNLAGSRCGWTPGDNDGGPKPDVPPAEHYWKFDNALTDRDLVADHTFRQIDGEYFDWYGTGLLGSALGAGDSQGGWRGIYATQYSGLYDAPRTLDFWIKETGAARAGFIVEINDGDGNYLWMQMNLWDDPGPTGANLRAKMRDDADGGYPEVRSSVYSNEDLPFGAWRHFVVTHDGVTMDLYMDGTLLSSTPSAGLLSSAPNYRVMVRQFGGGGPVLLDNLVLSSTSYTQADVTSAYNGGAGTTGY